MGGRVAARLRRLWGGDRMRWGIPWALTRLRARRAPSFSGQRPVLVALCDHFEPLHGGADEERGRARVAVWRARYPELASGFVDDDGRPPRHTFFFPGEQYRPE